jgi:hypothetical protein
LKVYEVDKQHVHLKDDLTNCGLLHLDSSLLLGGYQIDKIILAAHA